MRYLLCFILVYLSVSLGACKAFQGHKSTHDNTPSGLPPMICKIQGRVISILPPYDRDTGSICARLPCRAKVWIVDVAACGSPAASLSPGDTVEIKFAYTVLNTVNFLPNMKEHYSGIRDGDYFTADVETRPAPGVGRDLVVYGYVVR